ncbi:hypothetical protein DFH11DRAFT_1542206 [Phellopilus nigrolimitatus]|nr:hypothetical protein DFH11DRAFT_1542206 [Phellopilus nigrolimitatus]
MKSLNSIATTATLDDDPTCPTVRDALARTEFAFDRVEEALAGFACGEFLDDEGRENEGDSASNSMTEKLAWMVKYTRRVKHWHRVVRRAAPTSLSSIESLKAADSSSSNITGQALGPGDNQEDFFGLLAYIRRSGLPLVHVLVDTNQELVQMSDSSLSLDEHSLVDNGITDDEHEDLDAIAWGLKGIDKIDSKSPSLADLATVLTAVVLGSQASRIKLNKLYRDKDEATALLRRNKTIEALLRKIMSNGNGKGSFKEIRQLRILQAPGFSTPKDAAMSIVSGPGGLQLVHVPDSNLEFVQISDNTFSSVDNGITDEEHEAMDKITWFVIGLQNIDSESPSLADLATVLTTVVLGAQATRIKLNDLYSEEDEATALLKRNKTVETLLRNIVSSGSGKGSFKELRRLRGFIPAMPRDWTE